MSDKYNIGIDIGGTKVNIGIVEENGTVLKKCKIPTNSKVEPKLFIADISRILLDVLAKENLSIDDINSIGVGVPGTANSGTGIVSYCPNLFWYDVPVGQLFKDNLCRDVIVCQDSWNAALAESVYGAGKNFDDIICLAIGTGIGGGLIHNKKIFAGKMNTAGEIGHTPVVKGGRKCVCGNYGCLEQYASGKSIIKRAYEIYPQKFEGRELNTESVFALALEGDVEIIEFIDDCVDYLAFGLANSINIFAPQAIVISGGLCVYDDLIIKPLEEKIYKRGYYSWTHQNIIRVYKAELGSDAPMIGASIIYRGI